jgi:transposase-like protein
MKGGVLWVCQKRTHQPPHKGQEYATMTEPTVSALPFPSTAPQDVLTQILRKEAPRLLAQAVEAEAEAWLAEHVGIVDERGHRRVVRNGHLPQRSILTGLGPVAVTQPRLRDKRSVSGGREKFTSKILPPYLRKAKSVEELIPWLYLKGISTGDMSEALAALLGPAAVGLSASVVTRLLQQWQADYQQWRQRSLAGKTYVYLWADGIYFNIRLEDEGNDRQCILVLMGATAEGQKELIAVADGYRESAQSWSELLLDCQARGLTVPPKLAVGDGALGFWAALARVFPTCRAQRCWVHKTANVLNKLPQHLQAKAKSMLHDIWMAQTRAEAVKAFDLFLTSFRAKYPAAVECLEKDRDVLLTFYDFPAQHWVHLRTTNPIESTFATVRLRHDKTKGNGSRIACLTMVFKLAQSAARGWRTLNGSEILPEVLAGVAFEDGIKKVAA